MGNSKDFSLGKHGDKEKMGPGGLGDDVQAEACRRLTVEGSKDYK